MKISVITPSYNSANTIERAIKSVLVQAYDDFEHVIVDGGSKDGTLAILDCYPHLVWISEPDDGMVDAMAKGFAISTGEVVVYLNADDHFLPGAFAAVTPLFATGSRVVMGRIVVRTDRQGDVNEWINDPHTDLETMLRHWGPNAFCVNPVGYFIAREVQEAIPHNTENEDKHDLEFLLEIGRRFTIEKVDATLGVFNHAVGTITQIQQADPDYWNVENFAFVERILKEMPTDYQTRFRLERERGYQLRRLWTSMEAFANGHAPDLLSSRKIFFLPQTEPVDSSTNFVEFDRLATRGDWIIPILANDDATRESIRETLTDLGLELLPACCYLIDSFLGATEMDDAQRRLSGAALRSVWRHHRADFRWKIIIVAGEPIAAGIAKARRVLGPQAATATVHKFGEEETGWFEAEVEQGLGLDLQGHRLDPETGYLLLSEGNIELLVIRSDSCETCFSSAMDEFLGIENARLNARPWIEPPPSTANLDGPEEVRLDADIVDRALSTPMMRCLYSDEELRQLELRWASRSTAAGAGASASGNSEHDAGKLGYSFEPYSTRSRFTTLLGKYGQLLYPDEAPDSDVHSGDLDRCNLKHYQDLFIYEFIIENMLPGATILEVGGGWSRVLDRLSHRYECWNVDKFEGVGDGPTDIPGNVGYHLILDYIGRFNQDIPSEHFDLVFSISVIEHLDPEDRNVWVGFIDDIQRILKPGGHSVHCVDGVIKASGLWEHGLITEVRVTGLLEKPAEATKRCLNDPDIFVMSEENYERTWQPVTGVPYSEFGRPMSLNLRWQKASNVEEGEVSP